MQVAPTTTSKFMTKLEFEELQHKFHSSGKPLKAFLREEGIAYSTHNYWSRKLRDEAVTLPIAPIELHERRDSYSCDDISMGNLELPRVTLTFPNGVRTHFGRSSDVNAYGEVDKRDCHS